ncbi:Aste57867_25504 [Aphanomyces stellatus]|uniref:Aste57867_25504 protein n=1 Tax=Aphanomyces stellatus TaxID=120398 RepID=A0A485LY40_9STRA|nr:hypothetical protein As57867_025425 [Aphanomyces stellatus]VFU02127.1 Aste57867_25504 [Aphanomyces stellatus]
MEVSLNCLVVGEETPFPVDIDAEKNVGHLKDMIKEEIDYDGRAKDLELYRVDGLAQDEDEQIVYNGTTIDMPNCSLVDFSGSTKKLAAAFPLCSYPQVNDNSVGKIHVLVVVPEGAVSAPHAQSVEFQDAVLSAIREIREIRSQVEALDAKLSHKSDKSITDGALGQTVCLRLKKRELIIDVAPIHDEAFWSPIIQQQANAITNEAAFDAFITPFFNLALADCGLVFVKSERYQWLSQSTIVSKNTDLKPDDPGMFRVKPEPQGAVVRPTEHTFRFGVAVEEFCVWPSGALSAESLPRGVSKRYSLRSLVLLKAKWVDGGSKSLFQKFIAANKSLWVSILTNACSSLGVHVVEGDEFLGCGASVFKVIGQGGEVFALKIVEECFIRSLYQEEEALTKAQDTGLTVRLVGNCIDIPCGAALLMSPVGKPLPQPTTRSEVANLFRFLWQLHEVGLIHGDPRVPNVILVEKQPLWIGFMEMGKASPNLRKLDAEILTRSTLHVSRDKELSDELKKVIDNYGKNSTPENINLLATLVCQSMQLPN